MSQCDGVCFPLRMRLDFSPPGHSSTRCSTPLPAVKNFYAFFYAMFYASAKLLRHLLRLLLRLRGLTRYAQREARHTGCSDSGTGGLYAVPRCSRTDGAGRWRAARHRGTVLRALPKRRGSSSFTSGPGGCASAIAGCGQISGALQEGMLPCAFQLPRTPPIGGRRMPFQVLLKML